MDNHNFNFENSFKIIIDSFSLPVLIIQLAKEINGSRIIYFNSAFTQLANEYILFPKPDFKVGDSFELFRVTPGTKIRQISTVLEGLQKIFQDNVGQCEIVTVSLIKRLANGKELDVSSLENLDNQVPYQITLIKLSNDTIAVLYENLRTTNGKGVSFNLTNLVNLSFPSHGALVLKNDRVNYTNIQFLEMLGYDKPSDVIDKPIEQLILEEDCGDFKQQLEHLSEAATLEITCRFKKKDGSIVWLRLNCGIFNLGHHLGDSIVINVVDITEQKKTELALFQTHRMASIGELSSGVAHEINNPLFGIMNYAGLIKDAIDEGEMITKDSDEYEFITGILEESERISKIVSNLSEFSRNSDEREFSETNIPELLGKVENVLRHQLKKAKVTIERSIPENFPSNLQLQTQRIRTALFNMVQNSIQAVNPVKDRDHKIKVTMAIDQKNGNPFAIVKLWDNGIGIEDDKLVKVFDPFYTSNRSQKTGLGLHTVYQIIKDHGGEIQVNSKYGQWTEFTIRLPMKTL